MALKWAVGTGVWSATGTWNSGTLPQPGDEVHAGGFTVTIDQDVNVGSLCTHLNGSAAAGGGFALSSMTTRTIAAAIGLTGTNNTTAILTVSAVSGTLTLTGNVFGSLSTVAGHGLVVSGAGCTVNVTGNIQAGSVGSGGYGINVTANAIVNVTGNVTGGSGTFSYGINYTSAATTTITGNVLGGTAGGGFALFPNTFSVTITVTGTTTANVASAISAAGAAIITLRSTITAVAGVPGIQSTSTTATCVFYGPFVSASDGTQAAYVAKYYVRASTTITYTQRDDSGSHVAVTISSLLAGLPATADVRLGTTYGSGGTNTGTLAVPAAGSVALGVAVDATTGTAALTAAAVWSALISGLTTSGSIGERLATAATVATTGDQLTAALNQ